MSLTAALTAWARPGGSTGPERQDRPSREGQIVVSHYVRGADIGTIGVLGPGGSVRQLTRFDTLDPAISDDGRRIAFVGRMEPLDAWDIWTARSDGSQIENLTHGRFGTSRNPDFSPDGRRILFSGDPTGGVFDPNADPSDVFVMNVDGSRAVNLTTGDGEAEFEPQFSPDGSRIVYLQAKQGTWIMRADGSHRRQLVKAYSTSPTFSPDGKLVAYIGHHHGRQHDIAVIRLSDRRREILTRGVPGTVGSSSFSPDGRRIAYSDGGDIWTMRLDGTRRRNLTRTPDIGESDPDWSRARR